MWSVGSLVRSIAARLHGASGWLAYRIGLRSAARSHFERVLSLRGADFGAYVHLARIAFDVGDYASWRRELEHARRLDPVRFARLRHPLELFEPRLAGTTFDREPDDDDFDGTGARATWRSLRPFGSGRPASPRADFLDTGLDALAPGVDARADTSPSRFVGRLPEGGEVGPDASASHDDFVSADERSRFRELGPIAPAELKRCDLDELLRRLCS